MYFCSLVKHMGGSLLYISKLLMFDTNVPLTLVRICVKPPEYVLLQALPANGLVLRD